MIQIRIKKSRKISKYELSVFLNFNFDMRIVKIIKEFSPNFYHLDTEEWEVSPSDFTQLIKKLAGFQYKIYDANLLYKNTENSYLKTEAFPHQVEALQYGMHNDKFHLGDEQGLGKTRECIDIAVSKKIKCGYSHCLIICGVATLRWNWKDEIEYHSTEECCLLGFRELVRGKNKGALRDKGTEARLEDLREIPEAYFWVINIEALRDARIVKKLQQLCENGIISMIIAEEIHKMKNPTCKQSRGFLKLTAKSQISVSGTPLVNNPVDLFVIFKWHGIETHTYTAFKNHYCVFGGFAGKEIVGYRDLKQISERLKTIQLRRLKKDVLSLPQKLPQLIFVEMGKQQENLYNEILINLQQQIDLILLNPNPLSQLTRLRQATGCPQLLSSTITENVKLDKLDELLEDIYAKGEQCLVFSNFSNVCEYVYEKLSHKYKLLTYTGKTKNLQENEKLFKQDKDIVALIGTIKQMGTGLTFTNCNHVIFLDSPWTKVDKDQCIDRTHRIGQTQDVNIYTIVCANTIDEKIEKIIRQKGKIADAVVDNVGTLSRKQTLDFLLF